VDFIWFVSLLLSLSLPFAPMAHAPAMQTPATAVAPTAAAVPDTNVHDDHARFDLRAGGEVVPYDVMAAFVLPGETLPIQVGSVEPGYVARAEAGTITPAGTNAWSWRAPLAPGTYPVRVVGVHADSVTLNVFVMVPYDHMKYGMLDHYAIGAYPVRWPGHGPAFDRPAGFVEVTAANESTHVAPHFELSQFVCKSGNAFPKFVVMRPELLVKLERLLETVNAHGADAQSFHLMSAYRTPRYNRAIGNTTTFSRHEYGDAADIFVDEHPADGRMDDLNGDGRETAADARVLSAWAEDLDRTDGDLVGGLSAYGPTESHGPFVHVDARGYAARW